MKNLYLLIVIILLTSCRPAERLETITVTASDETYFYIHSDVNLSGKEKVRVLVLDDCEYLVGYRKITHKGNCKNPFHNENEKHEK